MVWWLRRLLAAGLFNPLAVEIFEIQKKARYLFRISKKTPRSINLVAGVLTRIW